MVDGRMVKTCILSFVLCFLSIWLQNDVLADPPTNDNYSNSTIIQGQWGSVSGSNVEATAQTLEPWHGGDGTPAASIWFSWTAPLSGFTVFDTAGSSNETTMAVYTGTTLGNLTQLDCHDGGSDGIDSIIFLYAISGTTYHIAVDGHEGDEGEIVLNWSPQTGSPLDYFVYAEQVTRLNGSINVSNTLATSEPDEPNHGAAGTPASSIWIAFTPPVSSTISFDTFGSDFDTTLAVYTGSAVNNLIQVTANDDIEPGNHLSRVSFPVVAGATYFIAIDGFEGEQGNATLNWQPLPPGNDNFSNAVTVSGSSGTFDAHNLSATAETGEPFHGTYFTPDSSVWFRWIAPSTQSVSFEVIPFTNQLNSSIAVYTGSSLINLNQLAANYMDPWNSVGDINSRAVFSPTTGNIYYIAIDGYNSSQGAFSLSWEEAPMYVTISGLVSLPDMNVAPPGGINVFLTFIADGNNIDKDLQIQEGLSSIPYSMQLPVSAVPWTLKYTLHRPIISNYLHNGYFNSSGTVQNAGNAEEIAGGESIYGIDLTLIPSPVYTVTPSAGANGRIDPDTPQTVHEGYGLIFTITPDSGYYIDTVTGCPGTLSGNTYTTDAISTDCSVSVTFTDFPVIRADNSSEFITNVSLGTIDNDSDQDPEGYGDYTPMTSTVGQGITYPLSVEISPDTVYCNEYVTAFIDWNQNKSFSDDGEEYPVVLDTCESGPHTIQVAVPMGATPGSTRMRTVLAYNQTPLSFGNIGYGEAEDYTLNIISLPVGGTVTPSPGPNGSMNPSGPFEVALNSSAAITVTPDPGYRIDNVIGCNGTLVANTYTTGPITENCTVTATFILNNYTVTPNVGANGSVTPSTPQTVTADQTTSFTILPDPGYFIDAVSGCGGTLNGRTFITDNIYADCTVMATFAPYPPIAGPSTSHIIHVLMGTIDNTTGPDAGYGNFTSLSTIVTAGSTETISVSIFSPLPYDFISAYFDWNQNGVFTDPGEEIYVVAPSSGGPGPFITTIPIPSDALPGPTVMRVALSGFYFFPVSSGFLEYGEAEDYTVFVTRDHTVTPSAEIGGNMNPAIARAVEHGDQTSFQVIPDDQYQISSVSSDTCGGSLNGEIFTTGATISDCSVTATFLRESYTVTPDPSMGGSLSPRLPQNVMIGEQQTFTIIPNAGYDIYFVSGCNGTLTGNTYLTGEIKAACTITALFEAEKYKISPVTSGNGSITPASPQSVQYGGTTVFTITPDQGFKIKSVSSCNGTLYDKTFTAGPVTEDCIVMVEFEEIFPWPLYIPAITSGSE